MCRKALLYLTVALLVFATVGCNKTASLTGQSDISAGTNESQASSNQDESTTDPSKILLLEDYSKRTVTSNFEEGNLPETKNISIPHTTLKEKDYSFYDGEAELDILVQYIKAALDVNIDSNWKVVVHYYDDDKSVGLVQFIYTIGEIDTNRSIVFNISDGKYDTVSYKCLAQEIDQADLTNRVNEFKRNYIQQKRLLQDGEAFYKEQTSFNYYIHSGTLVYTYTYYFQYLEGVINNDWGTERIIDKNGVGVAIEHLPPTYI